MLMRKVMLNITSMFLLVLFCCFGFNVQAKVINKNQKESSKVKVQTKVENKNQNKVENKSKIERPQVSVIIPVYNTEPYLRQCMDSIVNQTLKDIEIICVNDGSTDNSLNILKEYESKDPRVIVIDKEHKNAGAARNAGLKIAKGDYLVFIDSDDYAEPDYLKLMYEKIVADDADVCVCNYKIKYEGTNIIKERMFNIYKPFSYRDFPSNFMSKVGLIPWNKMIRKSLVTRNNLSFQEIKRFNDNFFSFAVTFKSNKIVAISKPIYIHRVGDFNHLQNSIHDDPHLIFDAADKIYKWIIDQGIYKDAKSAFVDYVKKNTDYVILELQKNDQTKNIQRMIDEIKKERDSFLLDCEKQEQINKKHVPIAMATDDNYVLPTIVSMTSMLENANKNSFYNCYLLISKNFTDENKNKFLNLQEKYKNKCEIKFINMDDAYKHDKICKWITTPMYYRLSLPSLLKDENKCIYMDGDTIVNKDLSELYDLNIDEYYLAGVKAASLQSDIKRAQFLGISNMKKYINSGVLLMNLKKMRDEKLEDKFSKFIKEKVNTTKRLTCPDQDTINAVCYDKIKILPFKYNVIAKYLVDKLGKYEFIPKAIKCYSFKECNEAKDNPVIIHYADKKKPWKEITPHYSKWWKYAEKSPVYEEIKRTYRLNSELKNKLENSNTQRDKANKNRQKAA